MGDWASVRMANTLSIHLGFIHQGQANPSTLGRILTNQPLTVMGRDEPAHFQKDRLTRLDRDGTSRRRPVWQQQYLYRLATRSEEDAIAAAQSLCGNRSVRLPLLNISPDFLKSEVI